MKTTVYGRNNWLINAPLSVGWQPEYEGSLGFLPPPGMILVNEPSTAKEYQPSDYARAVAPRLLVLNGSLLVNARNPVPQPSSLHFFSSPPCDFYE
ncbi:hypothetical protein MGYG_08837 [Nannizzia gypsea CBS 118893]|uniref:Uncharacterized protein n=1 Tax=Arthroderma gypseum (strain ATCC MYA-4604 / CBS 118893) TaxID=535722 RepID=E4V746_ARTGP|nr:hypothetical protein MGYG_08837 [Nannizzia gypsea CBS 118893]EFQ96912.1 hypothetical protein MGYG_08837 [Nannizzia gypsea CBS 118893]